MVVDFQQLDQYVLRISLALEQPDYIIPMDAEAIRAIVEDWQQLRLLRPKEDDKSELSMDQSEAYYSEMQGSA